MSRRNPEPFAARLRALREAAGLSVAEFARAVGLTRAAVYNLESGAAQTPTWDTVQKLVDLFDVTYDDLRTLPPPAKP